jgi:hypothetical protein
MIQTACNIKWGQYKIKGSEGFQELSQEYKIQIPINRDFTVLLTKEAIK